ncbi:hypothetical protein [Pseudonocardia phyllosphaerae]|uniref:hypothetical protein n=1 Tax=Pseudonocardia phyllosphaerae TaxID=3390502 RepID=UPI00397A54F4
MSAHDTGSGGTAEEQARALRRLAERLDDTAHRIASITGELARVWDDPAGHGWADRLERVRWEAMRLADAASADAAQAGADGEHLGAGGPAAQVGAERPASATERHPITTGLRLGATTGTRTTDRRGMTAPLLPPHEAG